MGDYEQTLRETISAVMERQKADEQSSQKLASLASRALNDPGSLSNAEIQSLAGSVLTQAPDRK